MHAASPSSPPEGTRRAQRIATVVLGSVCVIWGSTFLLMKIGTGALLEALPAGGEVAAAAFFNAVRFGLAAALMPVLVPSSVRRLDRAAWKQGFLLSLVFTLGFLLQTFGLTQPDVPPSQSAFLTSMYVVATPIIAAIALRRWPPVGVLVALPLAVVGAGFISGPPSGGLSLGAWATVACAVAFGGHIVLTDHATRRADPLGITLAMLLFAAVETTGALLLTPGGVATLSPGFLARVLADPGFVVPVLLCATLATVLAVSLLNRWQKELDPSRAGLVYTGEPVCAALISVAAGFDAVDGWLLFGAAMILLANLAAELLGRRRDRPRPRRHYVTGSARNPPPP